MDGTENTHKTQQLKHWSEGITVYRFDNKDRRDTRTQKTLRDFFNAVQRPKLTREDDRPAEPTKKDKLPAWALCNDTGDGSGTPNGLMQIDFDRLDGDPEEFKQVLVSRYPGILFAALSASGKNVFALIYAPDHDGGIYAADHIAAFMHSYGFRFDRDTSCDKQCQLRFEPYDPSPYIAPTFEAIAPDYSTALLRSPARNAFRIWANGEELRADDYEAALTAICTAALCVHVQSDYGLGQKFPGACDVQILGESGCAKTYGRIKPLRKIARESNVRDIAGLRTTDSSCYDEFLEAACNLMTDEKGRVFVNTVRDYPKPTSYIVDESGDTDKSNQGNQHKTQQNLIRRIAPFDGEIAIGRTSTLKREFGDNVPNTVPVRLIQYRVTTPNQLNGIDFNDLQAGGNGRRTLYAMAQPPKNNFLACDDLAEKRRRILNERAEMQLSELCYWLRHEFGDENKPYTFEACGCDVARQAAKLAFQRAKIPETYADTCLYNTALFLAVLRCGLALGDGGDPERFDDRIRACDLETATAICLNSFSVVRALTARSAAERLAVARTESEKVRLVIEYISGRKNKEIARGNLIRRFGRDVIDVVSNLCAEGVLREVTRVNKETGKNPNTYFQITPEGEEGTAAKEYAEKQARRAPKTRRRDDRPADQSGGAAKEYAECSDDEREERVQQYLIKWRADSNNALVEGNRNNVLNKLAYNMQKAGMWDDIAQRQFEAIAASSGLSRKEVGTIMRPRSAASAG